MSATVFSVLTPPGRGAVAVVAVAGPAAVVAVDRFFRARNRRTVDQQTIGRIVYGHWGTHGGEDLIVCRRGAELVEIHCHGGPQSVAMISRDLVSRDCAEIPWQQWLSRAGECPVRLAAQIALAEAVSARTAAILLDQFHGPLRRELVEIGELLTKDTAIAESRLAALLGTASIGLHLTRPWQVVIAGRPNVGKSSLINALVGYRRAIVFDQPGTTRDVVTASTAIDGWPVALSDTAGLHAAADELEVAGIELARERLAPADLVVWVLDATQLNEGSWQEQMDRQISELGLELPVKRLLVINKIDQVQSVAIPDRAIGTSALAGTGIDDLLVAISHALVPDAPTPGAAVLFTPEQRAAIKSALVACQQADATRAAELLRQVVGSSKCGD